MFADAIEAARPYTWPLIVSMRYYDGSVESGLATFIVLNRDGWILTAAHALQPIQLAQQHGLEMQQYGQRVAEIEANIHFPKAVKAKHIKNLQTNPKWVVNQSYWWGRDGVTVVNGRADPHRDLAFGQMQPFQADWVSSFPVFKNPATRSRVGTSLCRLGFPLHAVKATFDDKTGNFNLPPEIFPLPQFPNEGIYTRDCIMVNQADQRRAKFLETSSAGLRGQSGGPIFDTRGRIWAVQSRTFNYPLGFSPEVTVGKTNHVEHQFLNVGVGCHVEEVVQYLRENNIQFELSAD